MLLQSSGSGASHLLIGLFFLEVGMNNCTWMSVNAYIDACRYQMKIEWLSWKEWRTSPCVHQRKPHTCLISNMLQCLGQEERARILGNILPRFPKESKEDDRKALEQLQEDFIEIARSANSEAPMKKNQPCHENIGVIPPTATFFDLFCIFCYSFKLNIVTMMRKGWPSKSWLLSRPPLKLSKQHQHRLSMLVLTLRMSDFLAHHLEKYFELSSRPQEVCMTPNYQPYSCLN